MTADADTSSLLSAASIAKAPTSDLLPNQSHTRCARFGVPTGKTAIASMTLANSSNEQNGCSA